MKLLPLLLKMTGILQIAIIVMRNVGEIQEAIQSELETIKDLRVNLGHLLAVVSYLICLNLLRLAQNYFISKTDLFWRINVIIALKHIAQCQTEEASFQNW